MSDANPPSKDPADEGQLGGALRSIFRKLLQGVDGMLPARVLAYDREANVATVQPIVAVLTTLGTTVPRARIARVPVMALGGGGFVLNFPLQPGDLGWVEASDRDISLYLQSLEESRPNTGRLHSFEDARFLPDVMRQFDASAVATDAMTLQSADGTVRVEISPSRLLLVAPQVQIDSPAIQVNGTTTTVAGAVTFSGPVTMPAGATINGTPFVSHVHTGVTTGSGNSGPPLSAP